MIKNYNSFLLESATNELYLLLEAYISGSTGFLFKLKELSKQSGQVGQIADRLYDLIADRGWVSSTKVKQNFFDLTDSDDKVSFLQQTKLPDGYDEYHDPGLPYGMKGRNEIKIGRIIRYLCSLLNMNVSDKDIEEFVNSFKASKIDTSMEFKLVKGDKIAKYYNSDNYFNDEQGTLGGSCMRDEGKKMFKLYTENPKKVKLLVYLDKNEKVHGRAIVWKLDEYPKDGCEYFMDRVYTNRDSDELKFKKFAEEKGWMTKFNRNSHVETGVKFSYNGKTVYGEIKVSLDAKHKKYPFLDTLCFLDKNKTTLSNLSDKKCYFLHDVDGECDKCEECDGKMIDCWDCDGSGKVECPECDGDGCSDCKKGMVKCTECKLCYDCCGGHKMLKRQGIETKWNVKLS